MENRFKKVATNSETGRKKTVRYRQAGKAADGGDRIRPGLAKGDAYCAWPAKIKGEWKSDPNSPNSPYFPRLGSGHRLFSRPSPGKQFPSNNNPAFTQIELLAVLAIVGLLIALALPVLGKMRQSAQNSKSATNLRTLGAAMMLYAVENNGAFPPCASQVTTAEGGWAPGGLGSWDQFILPNLFPNLKSNSGNYDQIRGSESLFSHPNDRGIVTREKMLKRGYAMIHGAGKIGRATWDGTVFNPSARLSTIPDPSKTLLLVENPGWSNNTVGRTGLSGVTNAVVLTTQQPDLNGKEGHFHFLFADGHVQLLDLQETVGTGTLERSRGMWTIDPND